MEYFVWCMIAGGTAMALVLLFDGILDFDDDGWVFSIAAGALTFGAFGAIFDGINAPKALQFTFAGIFAFFVMTLMVFLIKKLKRSTDSEINDFAELSDLLGSTGEVVWWRKNSGEVDVYLGGGVKRIEGTSTDSLEPKNIVRIVGVGQRKLIVEKVASVDSMTKISEQAGADLQALEAKTKTQKKEG